MKNAFPPVFGVLAIILALSSAFTASTKDVLNDYSIFIANTDVMFPPPYPYGNLGEWWENERDHLSIVTDGATTFQNMPNPLSFDMLYPDEESLDTFEGFLCDFDTDGKLCIVQLFFEDDVPQQAVEYSLGDRR